MSKKSEATETEFEHPLAEQKSKSKFGWFGALALLSVLGAVIWLLVLSNEEA